jgi:hypothetical protein
MYEHVDELLPFYVNATLRGEQREGVEAHLKGCARCRMALREWEDLAGWVRSAAPLKEQAQASGDLPGLSAVVSANLRSKPSFPESVLSIARMMAAQRIFLKESWWVLALSAILLASVLAGLFLPAKYGLAAPVLFFILVPFLAVLGISFFENQEGGWKREIVAATPTHPGLLTFSQLTLVLGVIAGLALLGSLLMAVFGGFSLTWLVATWLGPVLWLTALATLLASLLNPWSAAGISLTLWGGISLLLATEGYGQSWLGFSLAPLLYPSWWSFGLQVLLAGILWILCWLWLYLGAPAALGLESSR